MCRRPTLFALTQRILNPEGCQLHAPLLTYILRNMIKSGKHKCYSGKSTEVDFVCIPFSFASKTQYQTWYFQGIKSTGSRFWGRLSTPIYFYVGILQKIDRDLRHLSVHIGFALTEARDVPRQNVFWEKLTCSLGCALYYQSRQISSYTRCCICLLCIRFIILNNLVQLVQANLLAYALFISSKHILICISKQYSLQQISYCCCSPPLWYILCKLLYLSWGFFVTYVQKIVYHFLQKSLILLQPISKHTKYTTVAYFWRDTSFIYT